PDGPHDKTMDGQNVHPDALPPVLPSLYVVDYVRVWVRDDDGGTPPAEPQEFVADYSVVGAGSASMLPADITGEGVQGGTLSRGPGIDSVGMTNAFAARGWNRDTLAEAKADGAYFQFDLTFKP